MFYQPGKAGFYTVNMATPTAERLQAFRGVGQMIGLALLLAEVFPLPLCRSTLKFLLLKEVSPPPLQLTRTAVASPMSGANTNIQYESKKVNKSTAIIKVLALLYH